VHQEKRGRVDASGIVLNLGNPYSENGMHTSPALNLLRCIAPAILVMGCYIVRAALDPSRLVGSVVTTALFHL